MIPLCNSSSTTHAHHFPYQVKGWPPLRQVKGWYPTYHRRIRPSPRHVSANKSEQQSKRNREIIRRATSTNHCRATRHRRNIFPSTNTKATASLTDTADKLHFQITDIVISTAPGIPSTKCGRGGKIQLLSHSSSTSTRNSSSQRLSSQMITNTHHARRSSHGTKGETVSAALRNISDGILSMRKYLQPTSHSAFPQAKPLSEPNI